VLGVVKTKPLRGGLFDAGLDDACAQRLWEEAVGTEGWSFDRTKGWPRTSEMS